MGKQSPRNWEIASGKEQERPRNDIQNNMPTVKLYASLRKLAGKKELSLTGDTVSALVNQLIEQNPPVGDALLQKGKLGPHIILTLNGQNIINLETPITEQDILAIFPPIAGGSHHTHSS